MRAERRAGTIRVFRLRGGQRALGQIGSRAGEAAPKRVQQMQADLADDVGGNGGDVQPRREISQPSGQRGHAARVSAS